jgi:hypothetical protein
MVMKITRSLLLSLNINQELLINRHTNVVTQFCEDSEFSEQSGHLMDAGVVVLVVYMMRVYFLPTTILMSNAKHISNAITTLRMQYM